MAALERHGVNTVEADDDTADTADTAAGDTPIAAAPRAKEMDPSLWPEGAVEVSYPPPGDFGKCLNNAFAL